MFSNHYSGVDNFLEVRVPKTAHAKFLQYRACFCMTTPPFCIVLYLNGSNELEKEYYSEVIKVAKLILVMPAANTLSERSFRALRRLKTWLHTTTDEVCFNSCMTLHVHKNRTDSIPLLGIGNEFIQRNSSRSRVYTYFWAIYIIIRPHKVNFLFLVLQVT